MGLFKKKETMKITRNWAFFIGILVALAIGLFRGLFDFTVPVWLVTVFILAGLVIGFLNITKKEATGFLVAVIGLMLVSASGFITTMTGMVGTIVNSMLQMLSTVVIPAGAVVLIKEIIAKGRN